MKFTSAIVSLALATGAVATPLGLEARTFFPFHSKSSNSGPKSAYTPSIVWGCLSSHQAQNIVEAFNYLLANPKADNFAATANALFADDFVDTSDSINQLAGIPEGSPTFASKEAFIAGSSSQPPLILESLDYFYGCSAISWRWISKQGAGNDETPVKGIDNFYINRQGQIERVYAEFNSGAWLANLGYPECSSH